MDTKAEATAIRQRAFEARISINALLKNAGVSGTTIWRWEQGETEATPITLAKIKDALAEAEAKMPVSPCGLCGKRVRVKCETFGCPV